MTSVYDESYPVRDLPPWGLIPQTGYKQVLSAPQYRPEPQVPVTQPLDPKFYINTTTPNPFTIKPIETQWKSNELLLTDPRLRTIARVAPLDIAHKQATNFVSPMHLNPGWKWCGGYAGCESR